MIDLKNTSGLYLKFDEENQRLIFGDDLIGREPDRRTFQELREVLFDKDYKIDRAEILYLMYRGVSRKRDIDTFNRYNFRYDVTVIFPKVLGREFNKTLGHYHPQVSNTALTFPEIYEVLWGQAYYLIQKVDFSDLEKQKVEEVVAFQATKGDKIVIPPNYGHITINPNSKETLIMANITAEGFSSIYEPIQKAGGGVYFRVKDQWIKNKNYLNIPPLKVRTKRQISILNLEPSKPLYFQCIENPQNFSWLKNPQGHLDEFLNLL